MIYAGEIGFILFLIHVNLEIMISKDGQYTI